MKSLTFYLLDIAKKDGAFKRNSSLLLSDSFFNQNAEFFPTNI